MLNTDRPNVGDYLIRIANGPEFREGAHGSVGEVFRVIRTAETGGRTSGFHVYLDHCSCNGSADHHEDFGWTWQSYAYLFDRYVIVTPEEAEKAQPLPNVEEVASFFRR